MRGYVTLFHPVHEGVQVRGRGRGAVVMGDCRGQSLKLKCNLTSLM